MIVDAHVQSPDDMNLTVRITMTVKEWKRLNARLSGDTNNNYVSDDLGRSLRTVLGKALQTFEADPL